MSVNKKKKTINHAAFLCLPMSLHSYKLTRSDETTRWNFIEGPAVVIEFPWCMQMSSSQVIDFQPVTEIAYL